MKIILFGILILICACISGYCDDVQWSWDDYVMGNMSVRKFTSENINFSTPTSYYLLILINPKKIIQSGTTYYAKNGADPTSKEVLNRFRNMFSFLRQRWQFEIFSTGQNQN